MHLYLCEGPKVTFELLLGRFSLLWGRHQSHFRVTFSLKFRSPRPCGTLDPHKERNVFKLLKHQELETHLVTSSAGVIVGPPQTGLCADKPTVKQNTLHARQYRPVQLDYTHSYQGCENGVLEKRCFCPLPKTGGFDEKNGENDDLHSGHKNKGLCSSDP